MGKMKELMIDQMNGDPNAEQKRFLDEEYQLRRQYEEDAPTVDQEIDQDDDE